MFDKSSCVIYWSYNILSHCIDTLDNCINIVVLTLKWRIYGDDSSVAAAAFKRSSSVSAALERVRPDRSCSSNAARVYPSSHARGESGDTCGDGGGGFCQLAVASAAMMGEYARRGGIGPRARSKLAGRAPPPSRSVSVHVSPAPVRHDCVCRPSEQPTDRVVINTL